MNGFHQIFRCRLRNAGFKFCRKKVENPAAYPAFEMSVKCRIDIITDFAVFNRQRHNKPVLGKQFKGVVNCGQRKSWILRQQSAVNGVRSRMNPMRQQITVNRDSRRKPCFFKIAIASLRSMRDSIFSLRQLNGKSSGPEKGKNPVRSEERESDYLLK